MSKELAWFYYRENNTGGSFIGKYRSIFIQAESPEVANALAQTHYDVYFNGCSDGQDCPCCGDRWSEAYQAEEEGPWVLTDNVLTTDQQLNAVVLFDDGTELSYTWEGTLNSCLLKGDKPLREYTDQVKVEGLWSS